MASTLFCVGSTIGTVQGRCFQRNTYWFRYLRPLSYRCAIYRYDCRTGLFEVGNLKRCPGKLSVGKGFLWMSKPINTKITRSDSTRLKMWSPGISNEFLNILNL